MFFTYFTSSTYSRKGLYETCADISILYNILTPLHHPSYSLLSLTLIRSYYEHILSITNIYIPSIRYTSSAPVNTLSGKIQGCVQTLSPHALLIEENNAPAMSSCWSELRTALSTTSSSRTLAKRHWAGTHNARKTLPI